MPNNILITPGSASIQFSGSAANTIRLQVEPSGSIAFYGNSGSLFGITDSLSGSLMSVNDISGLPILEVFSDDRVVMGTYNKNTLVVTGSRIGIDKAIPTADLDISGSVFVTGSIRMSGGGITGSLFGTSSFATSASFAVTPSGTSGTSGTAGSAGTSGSSGTSGSTGSSGSAGTAGSSGTSGTRGSSGSSGTSGANGSSGSSGAAQVPQVVLEQQEPAEVVVVQEHLVVLVRLGLVEVVVVQEPQEAQVPQVVLEQQEPAEVVAARGLRVRQEHVVVQVPQEPQEQMVVQGHRVQVLRLPSITILTTTLLLPRVLPIH